MDRGSERVQRKDAQQVERCREKRNSGGRFEDYRLRGFETSTPARDTGLPICSASARLWAVAVG
jgi:hypothetical protein